MTKHNPLPVKPGSYTRDTFEQMRDRFGPAPWWANEARWYQIDEATRHEKLSNRRIGRAFASLNTSLKAVAGGSAALVKSMAAALAAMERSSRSVPPASQPHSVGEAGVGPMLRSSEGPPSCGWCRDGMVGHKTTQGALWPCPVCHGGATSLPHKAPHKVIETVTTEPGPAAWKPEPVPCEACNATGMVDIPGMADIPGVVSAKTMCKACRGSGGAAVSSDPAPRAADFIPPDSCPRCFHAGGAKLRAFRDVVGFTSCPDCGGTGLARPFKRDTAAPSAPAPRTTDPMPKLPCGAPIPCGDCADNRTFSVKLENNVITHAECYGCPLNMVNPVRLYADAPENGHIPLPVPPSRGPAAYSTDRRTQLHGQIEGARLQELWARRLLASDRLKTERVRKYVAGFHSHVIRELESLGELCPECWGASGRVSFTNEGKRLRWDACFACGGAGKKP